MLKRSIREMLFIEWSTIKTRGYQAPIEQRVSLKVRGVTTAGSSEQSASRAGKGEDDENNNAKTKHGTF